jgi:hypothetical protein
MTTMATPGQPSVCFSCGHPIPAEFATAAKGGGGASAPAFPAIRLAGAVRGPGTGSRPTGHHASDGPPRDAWGTRRLTSGRREPPGTLGTVQHPYGP